jgi:molybdate transport system permease protein
VEVARLTGCKNFSRVRLLSENTVEALDWNCTLRVSRAVEGLAAHVGIRAHHIEFVPSGLAAGEPQENVFPCWLARSSETPFRVTLYLSLQGPPGFSEHFLQAEVSKEKWRIFRDQPLPWHVRLAPDSLFLMPS